MVTTAKHDPSFALGRDFWFTPGQNYVDEPEKYIRLYITSSNETIAYVEQGGAIKTVLIPANGIGTYDATTLSEMKSSGIAENKAIHVWDPNDDICVMLMSDNSYSGDGMLRIPTIGRGTDYVVAAYESLFEANGSSVNDFPSEFTITADRDNTIIEITPSCNLRKANVFDQDSTAIAFPRGRKFSATLDKGQCVQFQVVLGTDLIHSDVTGKIIHSNNPVGVVGASMCPNIPAGFSFCDYVTDMIPPTRRWGETYYSTFFNQPQGFEASHDSTMYLMIASKNNQVIHRHDLTTGEHVECTIDSQYHIFWAEEHRS